MAVRSPESFPSAFIPSYLRSIDFACRCTMPGAQIDWRQRTNPREELFMPAATQRTISPIDGSVYVERKLATRPEIAKALAHARKAQAAWRHVPVAERGKIIAKAVDYFVA